MDFLNGNELNTAIRNVCSGNQVRCAVAFWGKGAEIWFQPKGDWKIICNLKMGGTNPHAIQMIAGDKLDQVKQHDKLHAKVYFNDHEAIVTSANASANGLGQEDQKELFGWIECGVRIIEPKELDTVRIWFDELWDKDEETKKITFENLETAKVIWNLRRRERISVVVKYNSLLESLKNYSEDVMDRGICAYIHTPPETWSDAAAEALKIEKKARHNSKIDGWEVTVKDAMGPAGSTIVDFEFSNGTANLTGMLRLLDSVRVGKNWVQLCRPVEHSDGLRIGKDDKKILEDAAARAVMGQKIPDWEGPIEEFYEKFVRSAVA